MMGRAKAAAEFALHTNHRRGILDESVQWGRDGGLVAVGISCCVL